MERTFISVVFLSLCAAVTSAQIIDSADYPAGYDNKPKDKLKGPVHTVLTVRPRGEQVFGTDVEVYDQKGRLIESMFSTASIEVHSGQLYRLGGKAAYQYDSKGLRIRQTRFSPEAEFSSFETYEYDARKRLIKVNLFNRDGKNVGYKKYVYPLQKREVQVSWSFYGPGKTSSINTSLLTYDENGRWTSRLMGISDDRPVAFEYDAAGNLSKINHCCKYNYWHTFSYKFDKYGNWIERQDTYHQIGKNGENESTPGWMSTYRMITYYSEKDGQKRTK